MSQRKYDDAYDVLAPFGVTPDSAMAEIHRAGLEAQRCGVLTPERSQAWRELRDLGKRLLLDLFRWQDDRRAYAQSVSQPPSPWDLLDEVVTDPQEPFDPLPPPGSFLEELK